MERVFGIQVSYQEYSIGGCQGVFGWDFGKWKVCLHCDALTGVDVCTVMCIWTYFRKCTGLLDGILKFALSIPQSKKQEILQESELRGLYKSFISNGY